MFSESEVFALMEAEAFARIRFLDHQVAVGRRAHAGWSRSLSLSGFCASMPSDGCHEEDESEEAHTSSLAS